MKKSNSDKIIMLMKMRGEIDAAGIAEELGITRGYASKLLKRAKASSGGTL